MAISNMDQLVAALAGAQRFPFRKASVTTEGAGTFHSLFRVAGLPGAGALPATGNGEIPTNTFAGALPFTNPTGGNKSYLGRFSAAGSVVSSLMLYDRLWQNSGLSGNTTALQSFTMPALTRYSTGLGNEIWGVVHTAMGATASTFTVTYTNELGTPGRTATYVMPANALTVGQMVPFSLQAGDQGVRSIESLQLSVATGIAGDFGLLIAKRLTQLEMNIANVAARMDAFSVGMSEILDNACLAFMILCSSTTSGDISGEVTIIQG